MSEPDFRKRVPYKAEERARATLNAYHALRFDEQDDMLPSPAESLQRIISIMSHIESAPHEVDEMKERSKDVLYLRKRFEDAIARVAEKNTLSENDIQYFGNISEDLTLTHRDQSMRAILGKITDTAKRLDNKGEQEMKMGKTLLKVVESFTDGIRFLSQEPEGRANSTTKAEVSIFGLPGG